MKRILICLVLAGSAFAEVRVVPPIPTNLTPVTLYFRGRSGCPMEAAGAAVQRAGQTIRVHLRFGDDCILAVVDTWYIAVPLGALEAGRYEVTSNVDSVVVQFDVLDATTFPISPPGFHVNDCWKSNSDLKAPLGFHGSDLRFGNNTGYLFKDGVVAFDYGECTETGLSDLEVITRDGTFIARNGFTVYGGTSLTHPYVHEDVMVPIYLNGRGAGGDWRTELTLRAADSLHREVSLYAPWGLLKAGPSPSVIPSADIGDQGNGLVLRVARNGVERFRPELRVWNAAVPGVIPTRLPLVRERDWLAGVSVIERLPVVEDTRVTVRLYAPDEDLVGVEVDDQVRGKTFIRPTRASNDAPRFASYEFVISSALGLPKMTFTPREFGSRYWVMVTLTDNAGQVVVLTPQAEETRD